MAKNKIKATINADSVNNAPVAVVKVEDTVLLELCVLKQGQLVDFTNQIIYISALRADNSLIQQESFITVEKTKLMIQLNEKFNQVAGIVRMELTAKDQEGITTTADFYLRVNSRLLNSAIEKGNYIETLDKVKQDFITSSNALMEEFRVNSNLTFTEFREQFEELKQQFLTEAEKVREEFSIKGNTAIQAFHNSTQEVLHEFDVLGLQAITTFNLEGSSAIEEVRARGQVIEDYFRANIDKYKGDKGDKGDRGEKGDTGATGLTGAKGDTGAKGIDGTNGKDGAKGEAGKDGKDGKDAVVINDFFGGVDKALSAEKGKELDTRMTQVEDFSMFYQSKEAEGTVTWTNSYIGDIKDLIIKGKTVGGYNSETQQYDTIVSCAESEGNKIIVRTTGKNLWSGEVILGAINPTTGEITQSSTSWTNKKILPVKNSCYVYCSNFREKAIRVTQYLDGVFISTRVIYENTVISLKGNGIRLNGEPLGVADNKIMVEEGIIATDYVPYQEDKVEVQLPCSHREWNSYDGENGKYTEGSKKIVLDGTENWSFVSDTFRIKLKTSFKRVDIKLNDICDRYKSVIPQLLAQGKMVDGDITIYPHTNTNSEICVKRVGITLEQFKQELQANPTTVVYGLAEPIAHNIEKMPPLKSYKGTTHITLDNEVKGNISAKVKVDLSAVATALEEENKQLKQDLDSRTNYFEANDVNLLKNNLEMDFRLMEVEFALDIPINLNMKGGVEMAATPYEMMKKIILSGNYDRADYEYKISVYVKRGRMTQEEANELIALMDANELV